MDANVIRKSAIVVVVSEVGDLILSWRETFEPKGMPPHITLLSPWRPPPLTDKDSRDMTNLLRDEHPFTVTFTGVRAFAVGVVYLALDDAPDLMRLMRKLFTTFPDFPPYGGVYAKVIPHVSVAQAEKPENLEGLKQEVAETIAPSLPLTVNIRHIALMEQDENEYWAVHSLIPLGELSGV